MLRSCLSHVLSPAIPMLNENIWLRTKFPHHPKFFRKLHAKIHKGLLKVKFFIRFYHTVIRNQAGNDVATLLINALFQIGHMYRIVVKILFNRCYSQFSMPNLLHLDNFHTLS